MYIHAYLRGSTAEQDAKRAVEYLKDFAKGKGVRIASWTFENVSGASLERPALMQLLNNAEKGDAILLEQIDRLSRLDREDWEILKNRINQQQIKIVSVDIPTSHMALMPIKDMDSFTESILIAVNNMLLDTLAAQARKDYEDRRRRQFQGIEKAKDLGKYNGRTADEEKHEAIVKLRLAGNTIAETAKIVGMSNRTVVRVMENYRKSQI